MPQSVKRPSPLSLRLSNTERAQLASRAGSRPIGSYVKGVLFGEATRNNNQPYSGSDKRLLAQLIAVMGRSRIVGNLADLASAANSGSVGLDDETVSRINQACDDIRLMRDALMKALGKREAQ